MFRLFGNILLRTLFYPLYFLTNKYYYFLHRLKYWNFYFNGKGNGKTLLMLCHGRKHGIPVSHEVERMEDFPQLKRCSITTVDKNPDTNPHIVCDILSHDLEEKLAGKKFDMVALFNCSCHTEEINNNPDILSRMWKLTKNDGLLVIKNCDTFGGVLDSRASIPFHFQIPAILKSYTSYLKEETFFDYAYYISNNKKMYAFKIFSPNY